MIKLSRPCRGSPREPPRRSGTPLPSPHPGQPKLPEQVGRLAG